jgi:hypothetical protein
MFGPSGKLYQPPHIRRKLRERRKQREEAESQDELEGLAEAMARVNEEKRLPETPREDATAV